MSVECRIEKLNGRNYTTWKVVMTSLLKSKRLWEYCSADVKSEEEDQMIKNEEAKHYMYAAMESSQITATGACETAYELWNKLKENHEGAEKDVQNNALSEFLSFRYRKNESIIQYCGRYEVALGRVTATGQVIDNSTKIWVLRNSLPKDIKTIVNTWGMSNPNGKVSELITQLKIQFHMDKFDSNEESIALYSGEQNSIRRSSNSADKVSCNYCKKIGHKWRECRKLKADNEKKKNSAVTQRRTDSQSAGAFIANEGHPNSDIARWIVDSGASSHMTPNKSIIQDYLKFTEPKEIMLGDGKLTEAFGQGTIYFRSDEFSGELQQVLWVPELTENLFSVGRALSQGSEVRFVNDPPEVHFIKENTIKLRGKKGDRSLFVLNLIPILNQIGSALVGASMREWHQRFAHMNENSIRELLAKNAVTGLKVQEAQVKRCSNCAAGKMCRTHHPSRSDISASEASAVLCIDTVGPISTPSLSRCKYFVLATEEYSNFKLIEFVRAKSDVGSALKQIVTRTELQSKRPVKKIVTDNGSEYVNLALSSWLDERGIVHETSAQYTPEQNGRAERANRTIIEGIRTLLHSCKFTDDHMKQQSWAEAANTVVYTTNLLLSPRSKEKTRFELFTGKKPDVAHLRTFGQRAMVRIPDSQRSGKYSEKAVECFFLGYTDRRNTYRLFTKDTVEPVTISCDVVFTTDGGTSEDSEYSPTEAVINLDVSPEFSDRRSESEADTEIYDHEAEIADLEEIDKTLEECRQLSEEGKMLVSEAEKLLEESDREQSAESAFFTLDNEPLTVSDAQKSADWPRWKAAMDEELEALNKNQTWQLVVRPKNARPIKNKWVFKLKHGPSGEVERYKARLVAKGYSQIENIDYKETYAPVASMTTIRILFSIVNQLDMEVVNFDIKTAFLYGNLEEDILLEYPEGYPNPNNYLCKLRKSLYGLKQAPRQWNTKFHALLQQFKLYQSSVDKCLYYNEARTLLLAIYVDDGLAASSDQRLLEDLLNYLKSNFELKVMSCETFLGFQVLRNRADRTLTLLQSNFVDKLLSKFNMDNCNAVATPEEAGACKVDDATALEAAYPFKEMVGSLLYLVTGTRPDIAHAVSVASRTSTPTITHWCLLKRIVRYLKGSRDVGIRFRWEKESELVGYSDADYANDTTTRRSTTGYCIMFNGGPVSWRCQRQSIVTLSTTEAEYVSGCELTKELIPVRELLLELKQISSAPTKVMIDNQSTIKIAKNENGQLRTKHIDVRHKWLTEQVARKAIRIEHVSSENQAADILTKPLHKSKFLRNRSLLLNSLMILTVLTCSASARELPSASPLFFKPTHYQFFDGDTEYKLRLIFQNPCETFFNYTFTSSYQNTGLILDCHKSFEHKLYNQLSSCRRLESIGRNLTDIAKTASCDIAPCVDYDPEVSIKPSHHLAKRFVPLLTGIGIMVLTGLSTAGIVMAHHNDKNIQSINDLRTKERELLDNGGELFRQIRRNIHEISQWNSEIGSQLKKLDISLQMAPKIAALINTYENYFTDFQSHLKEINLGFENKRVPASLRHLSNETLWDEPAAAWSTFYACDYRLANKSLVLDLHFNMPKRNPSIKIMEAVPINFFNSTRDALDKPTVCWMKYRGPKHVLVNTTNNCMTEIVEWATENNSVRAQYCVSKEDELKNDGSLWEKETCGLVPHITKRVIQDREVNGLHCIYCYPYNITVENEHMRCPDHVFELEGRTTYRISNMEHIGQLIDRTVVKSIDLHLNREILASLKAQAVEIRVLNTTDMDIAYSAYITKLQEIPKQLKLSTPSLAEFIAAPIRSISEFGNSIMRYIRTFGIILGVGVVLFFIALMMPLVEVLFVTLKLIKRPIMAWLGSNRRILGKLSNLNPTKFSFTGRKKQKYWEISKVV